jgi:hypothetical protein
MMLSNFVKYNALSQNLQVTPLSASTYCCNAARTCVNKPSLEFRQ